MSKITYQDKVALNINSNIADINKVNASDMNEIKQVVNDNDDRLNNIVNIIYPVGSIYISINNTNPSTLFGGTWEQVEDKFLLGAGNTYTAGDTGGNENHSHKLPFIRHNAGGTVTNSFGIITTGNTETGEVTASNTGGTSIDTVQVGGNASSNVYEYQFNSMTASNMPPYLVVYMWKRTA